MIRLVLAVPAFVLAVVAGAADGATDCAPDDPVCRTTRYVFPVSAHEPAASGVYVSPGRLVTNRHVVGDRAAARVRLADGGEASARVVPSSYPGDLILLEVPGLDLGPGPAVAGTLGERTPLRVVAFDADSGRVKVYAPGAVILGPADQPLARLHHDAPGARGNSGGFLATDSGALAAIVTTGGEGRNEAIPVGEIARLSALSGPEHAEAHARISRTYRDCMEVLDHLPARRGRLPKRTVAHVVGTCGATRNRQLMDLAGQTLGRAGHLEEARELFSRALEEDPHSLNARLGLIVTLHLAGQYGEAVPHIRWLGELLPRDLDVIRLAIQAGKLSGDTEFAEQAYGRLKQVHPGLAGPMRRYLDSPLPPGFQPR